MSEIPAIAAALIAGVVFVTADDAKAMVPVKTTPKTRLTNNQVRAMIDYNNAELGNKFSDHGFLSERDVLRICYIESQLNHFAYRYEPHLNTASYGLMQILETTARDIGFNGPISDLYNPLINIFWGMKYLIWINSYLTRKMGRSPTKATILSAYNAGPGNVLRGYFASQYVAKFQASDTVFA